MRNLTIKREKCFTGSLVSMDVYIEDPGSDVTLCDTRCRFLGTLKNGKEITGPIGEEALKLFVIPHNARPDRLKVNLEYYPIPAGTDDVFVSGALVSSAFSGISFGFYTPGDADGLKTVKRKNRNGVLATYLTVFGVIIGIAAIIGLKTYLSQTRPKNFTYDGMTITLTNKFEKSYMEDGTLCFDSENVAVYVIKDEDLEQYEIYTLEDYSEVLMLAEYNETPSARFHQSDGLTYIEYTYTDPESKDKYHYLAYLYQSGDAFWELTFATYESDLAKYRPQIEEWAKSVTFAD